MNKLSLFKGFAGSFLFSLALSLIFVGAAQAQSGRATVKGLVKDQQGNVVAGATVTLSDQNKNFSRTQTSNQDGVYVFTAIPPGTYRIEVEAGGFKKTVISDVQAAVDTTIDVDAALEVGQVRSAQHKRRDHRHQFRSPTHLRPATQCGQRCGLAFAATGCNPHRLREWGSRRPGKRYPRWN